MNSLKIAGRLLLSKSRAKETYIVYLAFPLVLITILGFAFTSEFNPNDVDSKVVYHFKQDTSFTNDLEKRFGFVEEVIFDKNDNLKEAEESVLKGEYDLLLIVDSNNIEFVHDNAAITKGIVEALINFTGTSYVNTVGIKGRTLPSSIDFYGLTIMSMMIMYGAFISAFGIITEKNSGTLNRITVAPVKRHEFFFGITLGSIVQIMIQNIIIIVVGHYFLGVNYGTRPVAFGLILLSISFMAVAMGFCLAILVKSDRVVSSVISLSAQILVFVAGGYFELPSSGPITIISKLSPIYWVNNGLLEAVNSTRYQYVLPGIFVPLTLGLIMFAISQLSFRKGDI